MGDSRSTDASGVSKKAMNSSWKPFAFDEMFSVRRTTRENTEEDQTRSADQVCRSCGRSSLRFYYHELVKGGRIGTTYYWCPNCKKSGHSTGACRSTRFTYDDPFGELSAEEFGKLEKSDWFDHLDQLWTSGLLPQKFKVKGGKK